MRTVLVTWLGLATLAAAPLSQAQPADLQQRRQQLMQINQHQRALIDQQLRCINAASKISDLERCNSHSSGRGSMHSGSWSCPMW